MSDRHGAVCVSIGAVSHGITEVVQPDIPGEKSVVECRGVDQKVSWFCYCSTGCFIGAPYPSSFKTTELEVNFKIELCTNQQFVKVSTLNLEAITVNSESMPGASFQATGAQITSLVPF
jgi:hypothetical protein